jgi:hypothetical protein
MLLKDLTEVWISKYEKVSDHGEIKKIWKYKDMAYLNLQQDLNELDRNSAGEVDYGIENARTDMEYDIKKGNGISISDISKLDSFIPDYLVTDDLKIGKTTLYKLEKYNGD